MSAPCCGPCPCWAPRRAGLWGTRRQAELDLSPPGRQPQLRSKVEVGTHFLSLSCNNESLAPFWGTSFTEGEAGGSQGLPPVRGVQSLLHPPPDKGPLNTT